ncbi:MAG TPA: hypothetical protein GXX19_13805 [Syntrophomonadaceae bacterium]|nr:hypothetical protein [Syntrophomonadaceae bacterium]
MRGMRRMKKHLGRLLILVIITILLFYLSLRYSGRPVSTENYDRYQIFQKTYLKLLNHNYGDNFYPVSKKNPPRMITVFPEGLLLDKRTTSCFQDDPGKPTGYEMFFINKNNTVLIKLNLFYTPANPNKGILFYQVISPEDNINLQDNYTSIPRPIMVETYESYGDYGVLVNAFSTVQKPNNDLEKIVIDTINVNWEFVKLLESFLLETGK